ATSTSPHWLGAHLSSRRLAFVLVIVCATEERHFVEHVFLERFEPDINYWRNKQGNQLGENQPAHDHQPQRPTRCGILTESQCNRDGAHQSSKCRHHNWTKTFYARFVNGRAEIPAFVDSLQSKINDHDSIFLHNT